MGDVNNYAPVNCRPEFRYDLAAIAQNAPDLAVIGVSNNIAGPH